MAATTEHLLRDGQAVLQVVNPATGEPIAEVPECSPAELDHAFASAQAAQPAWGSDEPGRRRLLLELARAIAAAGDELTALLVSESGKPANLAAIEVQAALIWFEWLAGVELPTEVLADDERARIELRRKPIGVVAAITPWNFPIASLVTKIGPALRAGNTVVAKASPFTPLAARRLGEVINDVLPANIVRIVAGAMSSGR